MTKLVIANSATVAQQIQEITQRLDEIIVSVSAVVLLILWIPVALGFFSSDESRKIEARYRLKNAVIGTFIYILAASGLVYAIFNFIVTGS
ncbi:MAG TPA: hypothetical protein VKU79_07475 [Thermoplasmataceae archaeon]|nr:hypothetical protein [Thermoplasmataceae archaeon]